MTEAVAPASVASRTSLPSRARQFYALTKPRVVQLIVFCAVIGMLMSSPRLPDLPLALAATAGIWLVAAAAAAFNCLVERHIDARMARTAWRPTARGELTNVQTLGFSALLCTAGSALLYAAVNPLTMWLTFATFVGYAVVYTVLLKPMTPQNIVIGGASGAMPPVLGWAAMRGDVGAEALIMCLIIFLWTPPHFWALALYRAEDYRKSGLPMLPVTHGSVFTRLHVLLYVAVNPITMWLTFATFVGYAIVYTVLLKPMTPQNIVIGGASGAMPPVLGWAAVRGDVGFEALIMCLIIFLWTPPHFWALALYRAEDYRKSGLPMLPVTHGAEFTRLHVFLYTLVLFAGTLLPFVSGMSGVIYLVAAVLLNAGFVGYAWKLWRRYSDQLARKTFRFSIVYLSLLYAALLIDHYLRAWL